MACHSDSAGPTWTKIGTVKQLDPGNKPLPAFLQNLQIWPHTGRSKVKIFTFFLGPAMNEIFFWWEAIFFNFWKKISFFFGLGGKKIFWWKFFFNFFFIIIFLLSQQPHITITNNHRAGPSARPEHTRSCLALTELYIKHFCQKSIFIGFWGTWTKNYVTSQPHYKNINFMIERRVIA